MPDVVGANEPIARFLRSGHSNASRVLPSAFLPSKNNVGRPVKTSVCRHDKEPEHALVELAKEYFATFSTKINGVGVFRCHQVHEFGLKIEPSELPLRHAEITNWPYESDPDKQLLKWREVADRLARLCGEPVTFSIPVQT